MLKSRQLISLGIAVLFIWLVFFGVVRAADFGLSFDGLNDYVQVPSSEGLLLGTGDFSVESWIKLEVDVGQIFIEKFSDETSSGWAFVGDPTYIEFFTDPTGVAARADVNLGDGEFHQVVGVREGTTLFIYIDGVLEGQETGPVSNVNNSEALVFGASLQYDEWFDGTIDEVGIYNRALSSGEIVEHFEGTFSNETGLKGLWHFNEGSGSTIDDSSDYDNDGIIYNAVWVEGAGIVDTPTLIGEVGIVNTDPIVKLKTPIIGTYNKILSINYSALDSNSGKGALKTRPILLYYSDDGGIGWRDIAENQPNTGIYNFDTTKVPDGTNYKIRVVAFDGYDWFGDVISETFVIDNTGPSFDISISSFPVREKDTIELKITSSEELKKSPEMKITQEGTQPKTVKISGSWKEFFASYYVVRGYQGKAVISISGEDLMSNIGDIITSGMTFSVGRFGPPPPIIKEPVNNQVFTESVISVIGTSQSNTEVILTLNGITKFTTKPSIDNSFEIKNISLSTTNKGYNTISIIAIDEKGEDSEEIVLKIKLNSEPEILITSVFEEIISGKKEIKWIASDLNDDELIFSIEYSNDGGINWYSIISEFYETSYKFDTTRLTDGSNYLLRVTADDLTEKNKDFLEIFTIKNNLPSISLDIPSNYFANISTPIMAGEVSSPGRRIISVKYSLDRGKTWKEARAIDGRFNSLLEKFEISISPPLEDGKYILLIKAEDILNLSVETFKIFNIDTIAPITPVIESPLLEEAINETMDTNPELEGLQVVFLGKTDPETNVKLILEDKIYKTTTNEKGEFNIKDVTLVGHGLNEFSLSCFDLAENTSQIDGIIISDNLPEVSVLSPKEGEFFGGLKEISLQIKDLDNDPIVFQILYQKKDEKWVTLVEDLVVNKYKWDLSKLVNGDYQIKIIANDGLAETEIITNIIIDNIYPQVILDISGPLLTNNVQPDFSGQATDDFSGIQYVEYSFNNINWYKALISKGYESLEASFQFQPHLSLTDGDYKVGVRTTDRAGNITYSESLNLTIDTIPPRIGSNLISSGALILFPDETGVIKLFKDTPYKILVSVAGEAKEVSLKSKEIIFDFNFNKSIHLWESEFEFTDSGDYSLGVSAKDAVGNFQTKEIAALRVLPLGQVYNEKDNHPIKGIKAALYVFDQSTNSWLIWDAQAFNQKNPQKTDEMGEYGFLVPPGKYQLEVSNQGFETVRSQELEIKKNYLININIPMTEKKGMFNKILNYLKEIVGDSEK